jgi:hypothetical protein
MLGQRAMAGLAIHLCVLAVLLYIQNIRMARFTRLVAGKLYRMCGNFADGGSAVVSVLPKALGDDVAADHKKHKKGEDEEPRESEKMPRILEDAHPANLLRFAIRRFSEAASCDLDHSRAA